MKPYIHWNGLHVRTQVVNTALKMIISQTAFANSRNRNTTQTTLYSSDFQNQAISEVIQFEMLTDLKEDIFKILLKQHGPQ